MTEISAEIFDGLSTNPTPVGLSLQSSGLKIQKPNGGEPLFIKYQDLGGIEKTGQGFRCVLPLLTTQQTVPWVLSFTEETFYLGLKKRLAEKNGFIKRNVAKIAGLSPWKLLLLALIGLGLFFELIYFGLQSAYRLTPFAYDQHLGRQMDSTFSKFYEPCHSPSLDAFFNKSLSHLSLPSDHFPHRIVILNDATENALALPGGTIYVYRGLLERSTNPDELLGVISHEISHSELRHTVRQIIQSTGISYLTTLTIGMAIDGMDMLEGLETTLEMSSVLLTLRYSRHFESEADSQGIIRMHHAQLRVGPLDTLLTRISPRPRPRDRFLALFATHPLSKERSLRFKAAQTNETFPVDTLFASERANWESIKRSCPTPVDSTPLWKKFLK